MAEDIRFNWAAGDTVNLQDASDITSGATGDMSAAVDLGAISPVGIGLELILTTLTSATGFCFLDIFWSHDNSTYPTNGKTALSVKCTASTDVNEVDSIPVKARYFKVQIRNESGGDIDVTSSNTALVITEASYDQA